MEERFGLAEPGYYEQLETGARWLASRTSDGAERDTHLGHAQRYHRLRVGFEAEGR